MKIDQYFIIYRRYIVFSFLILLITSIVVISTSGLDGQYGYFIKGTPYGVDLPIMGDSLIDTVVNNEFMLNYYKVNLLKEVENTFNNQKYYNILFYYIIESLSFKLINLNYIIVFLTPLILILLLSGYKRDSYIQFLASSTRREYFIRVLLIYILGVGVSIIPLEIIISLVLGIYHCLMRSLLAYFTLFLIFLLYNSLFLISFLIFHNQYYSLIIQYFINILIAFYFDLSQRYSYFLSTVISSFLSVKYSVLFRNLFVYIIIFVLIIDIIRRTVERVDIK